MGILDNPTAEQLDILQTINDLPDEAVARIVRETDEGKRDIQYEFEKFHQRFPEVYKSLAAMARRLRRKGHAHLSIGMCWEVLRFETMLGDPHAEFRLNDNYRSRYARLLMAQEPDLEGCFETRRLRS